ncbi:hypothetical protein CEUSTIGMA_g12489.t1 [Chlamydomonas eustigma]|uniref:Uncharacterized protein n=1 Tax=Chlamydomonas eustigma TaxID=1157962 RepID=A0A250XQ50_9CHLO|nr:hypothetical protein CEUSTIGMA_g12489.t1 [Chlamydomonas eustigma]|eukprot:GAX85069.1 hypothetical protein CEUSTIGMA_g12489.t1 [Chlamydomonas eustigma]
MHSRAYYRARGRVAQYRELVKEAGRDEKQKRIDSRKYAEERALRHLYLLTVIDKEKELDKKHCQLCDIVRAEAFGLGHANWMQRRCSLCWAQEAELSSRARHLGSPMPLSGLESIHNDSLLVKIAVAEAKLGVIMGTSHVPALPPSEPHLPKRSVRHEASNATRKITSAGNETDHGLEAMKDEDASQTVNNVSHGGRAQSASSTTHAGSIQSDEGGDKDNQHAICNLPVGGAIQIVHPHQAHTPEDPCDSQVQDLMEEALSHLPHASTDEIYTLPLLSHQNVDHTRSVEGADVVDSYPETQATSLETLQAELKQAEYNIVFSNTQADRTRALSLAFSLRKGLAELHGLRKRQKKVETIEQYRRRVSVLTYLPPTFLVEDDAHGQFLQRPNTLSEFDHSENVKKVIGKERPQGLFKPGLALAAESKARRTARAVQELSKVKSKEQKNPKAYLKFGISASQAAKAAAAAAAAALTASAHQRRLQLGPPLDDPSHQAHAMGLRSGSTLWMNHPHLSSQPVAALNGPPWNSTSVNEWPVKGFASPRQNYPDTHPSHLVRDRAIDVVNWRPAALKAPLVHPPGWRATGDWDGLDYGRELAKIRHLKVDDWKLQQKKKEEWQTAVAEALAVQDILDMHHNIRPPERMEADNLNNSRGEGY